MSRDQPLVGLSSIRTRLAVLVGASVVVAAIVGTVGTEAGVPLWLGLPATIGVALVVTRWLAAGMTTPLIQMTDAAQRMSHGDYRARITTTSQDEVGVLARAFISMATELEQSEEHRRRLVATVAHELRTPSAPNRPCSKIWPTVSPPRTNGPCGPLSHSPKDWRRSSRTCSTSPVRMGAEFPLPPVESACAICSPKAWTKPRSRDATSRSSPTSSQSTSP